MAAFQNRYDSSGSIGAHRRGVKQPRTAFFLPREYLSENRKSTTHYGYL